MAAESWEPQAERLATLLGFQFAWSWPAGDAGFSGCVLNVPGTSAQFEIIAPSTTDSFVAKFLSARGPGMHHITLQVPSIQAAPAELARHGIEPHGGITDDGTWWVTYIHPRDGGGVLWQLFEPHTEATDHSLEAPFPPQPDGGQIGFKRIEHVSVAVPDIRRQVRWQREVLGMQMLERWHDEANGLDGCQLTFPGSSLNFEVIAPLPEHPRGTVGRFLARRPPGFHHLCCEVEDVEIAAARLREAGIEPAGGIEHAPWGRRSTVIHPRDTGGVAIQIFDGPAQPPLSTLRPRSS